MLPPMRMPSSSPYAFRHVCHAHRPCLQIATAPRSRLRTRLPTRSRPRPFSSSSATSALPPRRPPPSARRQAPHSQPGGGAAAAGAAAADGLSLKTKSVILAVAVAVIAASGAVIGASLRQEVQRSTQRQGSGLFSRVGSVQAVGAEALAHADAAGDGAASTRSAATAERGGSSTVAEPEPDSRTVAAQVRLLEAQRAALVQQRLVTERKIEQLRQRRQEADGARRAPDQTNENG